MSDASPLTLPGEALAGHPDIARLASALQTPQAAIRARLNAAVLDLLLLGLVSQVLAGALGSSVSSSTRALTFLALQLAYFFVFELHNGQTIGKRVFHVRVTTTTGAQATWRQIALRNVLRLVDALPFFYASGLISLMRTGPARRQRIGDVAAGTTVVLEPGGKELRTPRWLLPTLTVLATFISVAIIVPILQTHRPRPALAGEATFGGLRLTSAEGVWLAHSVTISSVGHPPPAPSGATWTITRSCPATGPCGMTLTVQAPGQPTAHAQVLAAPERWLAMFPVRSVPCGEAHGHPTFAQQHAFISMQLTRSGHFAQGEERDLWESRQCGHSSSVKRWTATLTAL